MIAVCRPRSANMSTLDNRRPCPLRLARPTQILILTLLLHIVHDNNKYANAATLFNTNSQHQHHHRLTAIKQLKQIIPPPTRHDLGGEMADDAAYARFLSVNDWDPLKAAPKLQQSFEWRKRIRPGTLRPHHCDTLCRQHAWVALLAGGSSFKIAIEEEDATNGGSSNTQNNNRSRRRLPLDTPHNCPPLQSWRTTRHGLPITYFKCWMWKPNKASSEEMERHMAYHMHHLIRRMRGKVERICIIFDMRGFEGWMLPYINQAVNVLRQHYPGRAGAMCFINVPGYFYAVWKVISPWLDDEIRSKTFFASSEVNDVEKSIAFLNKMNLKIGST